MKNSGFMFAMAFAIFGACTSQQPTSQGYESMDSTATISDDSLMTLVQYRTFQYFWDGAEPTSGAARERFHSDNVYPQNDKHIVTSGGTGFGLMAVLVGIERKFITRQEGFERLSKLVNWLAEADRFHGAWPHWMNGEVHRPLMLRRPVPVQYILSTATIPIPFNAFPELIDFLCERLLTFIPALEIFANTQ